MTQEEFDEFLEKEEFLFMDGKKEIRVCGWCNYA